MASFLERAQNLIDDHQDQKAATDSANQKAQALYTVRDNLLAKSMDLYHSYQDELAVQLVLRRRKPSIRTMPRASPASTTPSQFSANPTLELPPKSTRSNSV
jgi:hypothetical protein